MTWWARKNISLPIIKIGTFEVRHRDWFIYNSERLSIMKKLLNKSVPDDLKELGKWLISKRVEVSANGQGK